MAEVTGIAWTDSTFNPWLGCTKVGPGCDHCYAEALDKRHRWQGDTHWGAGKPRMRTSMANWRKPLAWQRHAENGLLPDGKTPSGGRSPRVFCASLADVFDNEVPQDWRWDLYELIDSTPALTWLLLTKRIGNAQKMLPLLAKRGVMANVWIGATIVNQEEADRDVPKLLATPAAKRFVSYEPALGPVDWTPWLEGEEENGVVPGRPVGTCTGWTPPLDWVIVGGESTQGAPARPFDPAWARSTIAQCRQAGVACFVKQLGSRAYGPDTHSAILRDRAGADPDEWPEDLRVREFPQ